MAEIEAQACLFTEERYRQGIQFKNMNVKPSSDADEDGEVPNEPKDDLHFSTRDS